MRSPRLLAISSAVSLSKRDRTSKSWTHVVKLIAHVIGLTLMTIIVSSCATNTAVTRGLPCDTLPVPTYSRDDTAETRDFVLEYAAVYDELCDEG